MTNLTFPSIDSRSVSFEVCEAFRTPLDHDEPVCAGCGHLADDHDRFTATVTPLRPQPVAHARPVRKAS